MTDRELWEIIWKAITVTRATLKLIEDGIAKRYEFGKYRVAEKTD